MPDTKTTPQRDPMLVPIQMSIRLPFGYHRMLSEIAASRGVPLNKLVIDALHVVHPERS